MNKTSAVFGLSFLFLMLVPAYGWEYADEWALEGGGFHVRMGSWISVAGISVLDGQGTAVAKLHRNQASLPAPPPVSAPATVKPKPRPRLGSQAKVEEIKVGSYSYEEQIGEASRFLNGIADLFSERWNLPLQAYETGQWGHELDLECIFIVDKQSGMIGFESITDTPSNAEMAQYRRNISQYDEPGTDYGKPHVTAPLEIARLKDFLRSRGPLQLPQPLLNLPGNPLRFRLLVKVVKISKTAGNPELPPATPAPEANASDGMTVAAAIEPSSGGFSTYVPTPGQFTRPFSSEELRGHTDIADPMYQYVIGFRYLEGDGLEKDYKMALHWFTKASEQGYAPAQSQLGFMYAMNYGAPRDAKKALYWYGKAAEQKDIRAISNIGALYQNGEGVPQDAAEAARWVRKGAELGDAASQVGLASRYASGEGVTKDPAAAFDWYMKAALQGNAFAQFNVGSMYEKGQGVPEDKVEALAWYNLAPTNGIHERVNHRERLERLLGPDAAAKASDRAGKLREKIPRR